MHPELEKFLDLVWQNRKKVMDDAGPDEPWERVYDLYNSGASPDKGADQKIKIYEEIVSQYGTLLREHSLNLDGNGVWYFCNFPKWDRQQSTTRLYLNPLPSSAPGLFYRLCQIVCVKPTGLKDIEAWDKFSRGVEQAKFAGGKEAFSGRRDKIVVYVRDEDTLGWVAIRLKKASRSEDMIDQVPALTYPLTKGMSYGADPDPRLNQSFGERRSRVIAAALAEASQPPNGKSGKGPHWDTGVDENLQKLKFEMAVEKHFRLNNLHPNYPWFEKRGGPPKPSSTVTRTVA
jgi:hypothetical protein